MLSARFFSRRKNARVPLDAIALLLLLNIAVGTVASLYVIRYSTVVRQANLGRLEAIATLKLTQINSWRSERLQDAWAFFENTIVSRAVVDYIHAPGDPARRRALEPILEAVVRRAQYRSVSIVGPKWSSLLSFPESAGALPARALGIARDMASARLPALSDPFLDSDGLVRIIIVSPVLDPATSIPIGAVAIEADPKDTLYPMIAEWPVPSRTSEAYIVREQEGRVKYLSGLRYRENLVLFSIAATAEDSLIGYHVVHGLLAFSEKRQMRSEPIEINAMLIAEREVLRDSLGPAVALRLELAPGELPILGDVDHLREALGHLAQNAKDAMPNGGSFTVRAAARELAGEFSDANGKALRGPFASLTVTDTGIGMDEATQKRLFEPFFTTKEFGSSAGIGLAAIYGIVRQHDGFIDVRSAPGEGATFTILIPLADDPSRN